MPAVLAATDVAVSLFLPLAEMESNSANKFFDGLAAGCCLAINYGGWQAELLNETCAGLRLRRDPHAAAGQLRDLADDPDRLMYAKIAARRLAEERFSRDKLAGQLEHVLVRAVEHGAPPRHRGTFAPGR
jgi:glycosyltransferase involved in cell wall biosynthesis